ncbi:hypothetical protein LOTGIDRAFT_137179, partial [Lottia gigantea]
MGQPGLFKFHFSSCGVKYSCTFCKKEWESRSHFCFHIWHHQHENEQKCSECDQKTGERQKFGMIKKKNETLFVCYICSKQWTNKQTFWLHVWTHYHKDRQLCQKCKKIDGFPGMKYLRKHLLIKHCFEKNFTCKHCGFVGLRIDQLLKHFLHHTNYNSLNMPVFQCIDNNCEYRCNNLEGFLSHLETHNLKQFECHECAETMDSLKELGQHLKLN